MSQTNQNNVDPNAAPPVDPNAAPPVDDAAERFKKDMLRYKDEAAALQRQIEDMKLKGHKDKEDYKSLAEHHELKAKDYETKYNGLKEGLIRDKKVHQLTLEAQKAGINPASLSDLELLDFDEVTVETTSTGKILVSGADKAIANLKTLRPHWFTTAVPSVNPTNPTLRTPNTSTVTLADVNAAEEQWKKTKSDSDKKIYLETIQKFKSQRAG